MADDEQRDRPDCDDGAADRADGAADRDGGRGEPARSDGGHARERGVAGGRRVTGFVRDRTDAAAHWFLVGADRNLLTVLLGGVILVGLVAVGLVRPFEMRTLVTETRAVQTLLNTLLSGVILLVSIVVSINSVVLTQEVSSLSTQQERVESTIEFRRSLEEATHAGVSPIEPSEFLAYILTAIREDATSIREIVADEVDPEFRRAAARYLDDVVERVDETTERLAHVGDRPRDVLFVGLEYDYAGHLYAARQLRYEYDDAISEETADCLDELVRLFQFFAASREYYRTLYIERELGRLSKTLLFVSLPAIVFTGYVLLAIDAGLFPTFTVPGVPRLLLYVSLSFVVALLPFILLTAYVLRVAVVSERSLAAGPLLTGERERSTLEDLE